jgi:hypothetical protein
MAEREALLTLSLALQRGTVADEQAAVDGAALHP